MSKSGLKVEVHMSFLLITFSLEQYFNDIFAFENRGTKRNTVRNGHPYCNKKAQLRAVGIPGIWQCT